ncbi:formin-like protein 3 [Andrographis paniculata]|uniref:formin-like protein 3 n=1 Tax=Andrographis paniculata TaxID=175694 RepID=UPI0021E913E8|nr:formin-like protein 3 [Andrographis paniculata]
MDTKLAVFLAALFCFFAAESSEVNRKLRQSVSYGGVSGEDKDAISTDMAEEAWTDSTDKLKECVKAVQGINLDVFQPSASDDNGVTFDSPLLVKLSKQNVAASLSSEKKETSMDCLRYNKLLLQKLSNQQETIPNKLTKLFSSWAKIPRRYLRHKGGRIQVSGPASSPAPAYEVPGPSPSSDSQPPANRYPPSIAAPPDLALSPDYMSPAPVFEVPTPAPSPVLPFPDMVPTQSPATSPSPSAADSPSQVIDDLSPGPSPGSDAPSPVIDDVSPGPSPGSDAPSQEIDDFSPGPSPGSDAPSQVIDDLSPGPARESDSPSQLPDHLSPGPSQENGDAPSQSPNNLSPGPAREENNDDKTIIDANNISPGPSQESDNKHHKYITAAAVTTFVVFFAFVAAYILYYPKKKKIEPKDAQGGAGQFHLGSGNNPAGSAQESQVPSAPNNMDVKAPSTKINLSQAESQSVEANAGIDGVAATILLSQEKTACAPPRPPPGPPPPPPPKLPVRAPAPPPPPKVGRHPNQRGQHGNSSSGGRNDLSDESEAHKAKLKPFFWDKVAASPSRSMVWNEIREGSFQVNEEMMEEIFGYDPVDKKKSEKDSSALQIPQFIQIIDPRKSQNLAIVLKASDVTKEEIFDALKEGNELPAVLCQSLLRMVPTLDEEKKLRSYDGNISHLGPGERFLKVLIAIPFAFKRLESLLFISTFQEEFSFLKESFETIELACKELTNSRLFFKLLEAVLKTGNRMNDGTYRGGATAFKLDALLKLSDVKGIDGKTTLLHFVVQEISRTEGARAARKLQKIQSESGESAEDNNVKFPETEEFYQSLGLQQVSGLRNELENITKAAVIDNQISEAVSKLSQSLAQTKEFLETEMQSLEGESEFRNTLMGSTNQAEFDIKWLMGEEKRIMALVKSTANYFHGKDGKDEGLRLFVIVSEFLSVLDKACNDIHSSLKLAKNETSLSSAESLPPQEPTKSESLSDMHRRQFPSLKEQQQTSDDEFLSDDES